MSKAKTKEEILSQDLITQTDIQRLFKMGVKRAKFIFENVQKDTEEAGKLVVPDRISWRRMYRMLGLPIPAACEKQGKEVNQ